MLLLSKSNRLRDEKMRFWKTREASKSAKRDAVIAQIRDLRLTEKVRLTVDGNGNVRDGDFILGSLDLEGKFYYPVLHKNMPSVQAVQGVMRKMHLSAVSSETWKPNP